MGNKHRKVRECRVKCVLPTEEVKHILILHSLSTKRIEDKISALSSTFNTCVDSRDADVDSIIKRIDSLSESVPRIGYTCVVALFVSSLCLIASLF